MEILYSILLGGVCGAVWAVVEVIAFFIGIKKADKRAAKRIAEGEDEQKAGKEQTNFIMKFFMLKYGLNVVLLLVIFLLRGFLPYRWEYVMLSAGIALAMLSQLLIVRFGLRKKK